MLRRDPWPGIADADQRHSIAMGALKRDPAAGWCVTDGVVEQIQEQVNQLILVSEDAPSWRCPQPDGLPALDDQRLHLGYHRWEQTRQVNRLGCACARLCIRTRQE